MPKLSDSPSTSPQSESTRFPVSGFVANKGLCRVVGYDSNGYFFLLTNRDERVYVHRSRIKFQKGK